ncbi:DUF3887 domain-containing protein [Brevundimonas pishanensis]|uniref:DUF3887 domain-containing protein n=1 Tax=Brevundimonas pishanensis TaxID=2896315 RepID=UPI001FA79216|nr:DUF3887 domain-containing protein [Brevundimonas pishanensis]
MKTIAISLGLTATLLASSALAQNAQPTAPVATDRPAAAATLPNAFSGQETGQAAPAAQAAPATAPTGAPAAAPDIARAENALRQIIAGLKSGSVDYSMFSDNVAEKVRPQASQIGSLLTQFGDLKSITHKGQPDGVDLFRVEFANQATEWVIGFDNDDQVAALLFRPAQD